MRCILDGLRYDAIISPTLVSVVGYRYRKIKLESLNICKTCDAEQRASVLSIMDSACVRNFFSHNTDVDVDVNERLTAMMNEKINSSWQEIINVFITDRNTSNDVSIPTDGSR